MSENTDYDKACREIARIAAALGIVDYSGDTSEIFDAIIIKDEKRKTVAAEGMLLRTAARDMLSGWKEIRRSGGESEIYGIGWDRSQNAVELALNTPSTDAALNEIKAQGVEAFADNWQGKELHSQISEMARQFAASLRGGE